MKYWLISLMSLALACVAQAGGVRSGKATAELLAQHEVVPVGGETLLALRLTPDEGWHSYWKNPGEMGMATSVEWDLPEGVKVSGLEFPAPHVFESSGVKSLGYDGEVVLLAKLSVSEAAKPGKVSVKGALSWLTCTADQCIPGDAALQVHLEIVAKEGKAVESESSGAIGDAVRKLPKKVDWQALGKIEGEKLALSIKISADQELNLQGLHVFISESSIIEVGQEVKWQMKDGILGCELKLSEYFAKLPESLEITLSGEGIGHPVMFFCKTQK